MMSRRASKMILLIFALICTSGFILCGFLLKNTDSSNISSGNGTPVKKVLILAYYRTGSSLTGDIFNQNEDIFYLFEPLHKLSKKHLHKPLPLEVENWRFNGHVNNLIAILLKSLYECKMTDAMTNWLFIKKSRLLNHLQSTEEINKLCLQKNIRVIKTIRITADQLEDLFSEIPDLRVIHLIRDPRGQMCSGPNGNCLASQSRWVDMCSRITFDIRIIQHLERKYPGKFLEMFYEDLCRRPQMVAKEMYNFIDEVVPYYVTNWLYNSTRAGRVHNGIYNTIRGNSIKTAYSWMNKIQWNKNVFAQEMCQQLLTYGNYNTFKSRSQMQQFIINLENEK